METIRQLLADTRTIAVVGLSDKPNRDSYQVAAYRQRNGYRIIPINPQVTEVLGEKSYASLKDVSEPIDLVNIFRKPEAVPPIVTEAIDIGARAIWMQLGVWNQEAAELATHAGLLVVMNRCPAIDHPRLIGASGGG